MIETTRKGQEEHWKQVCKDGYLAAMESKDSTFNPYKKQMTSIAYRLWDAGWEEGMREMIRIGLRGINPVCLNNVKALDARNGGQDAS
jgi:hypothetical protein